MKTRKGNVFLTLALAGFLAFGSPSPSANAAWKTTPNGKIYTQTKAPGYLTGMKKIGSNWYYFNKNGIMQGQSQNLQLNETGIRQATNLKNKLVSVPFTVCFTSPLIRAWSTAMIIVGDRVEIKEDDRLIERYLGDFEGKDKKEYDPNIYWDYDLNSNSEEVEAIQDIFKRCNSFVEDLKKNYHDDDIILVVSHGAITRCLHHILMKSNLKKNLLDFKVGNCYCREYNLRGE